MTAADFTPPVSTWPGLNIERLSPAAGAIELDTLARFGAFLSWHDFSGLVAQFVRYCACQLAMTPAINQRRCDECFG